ncbi:MAG: triphosphoribosyl-dephospho-CoA synthase [Planctomycetota bacterium]
MHLSTTRPPATIDACATLACIWEATAPKPGNVYRGADFEDLTYVDFLVSAAVVGPVLRHAQQHGVGATVLEAIQRTRAAVATNTNLGMMLLIAPLAAVPSELPLARGISQLLTALDKRDAADVFEAIRTAAPGGLGEVDNADVNDTAEPECTLVEAMQLAANRDLVAKQYTNDFSDVFRIANHIKQLTENGASLSDAIVRAFVQLLADHPDSLIARKCGDTVAEQVSTQASVVMNSGEIGDADYEANLQDFDFSLRVDGHRRNPGTSADLIAAALFVLLREDQLSWPVQFYGSEGSKP